MDVSPLNGERSLLVPNAEGFVAHQRHTLIDSQAGGLPREVDNWVGTADAWRRSPLARSPGWSVGHLPSGLVSAIRLV